MQHAAAMWQWELGKMEMQREPIYHKYSPQKLINSCNNQLVLLVLNICWYKGSNGVACLADAAAWGERQNLISREHETQTGLTADSVTVHHVDQGFTTLIIRGFGLLKLSLSPCVVRSWTQITTHSVGGSIADVVLIKGLWISHLHVQRMYAT